MNKSPIGIFDSGLGGLTVVKEILKVLPNENFIYLGDTARVPYGTRSKEIIQKFSIEDANFLVNKKVKCLIIACNTSSAMAGTLLKKKLKIPVFDVIGPALKYTNKNFSNQGVIGTRATIKSGAYKVSQSLATPLLVPFIEEGEISGKPLELILKKYLDHFKNIDSLILGCTHYPIVENLIQKIVGKKVKLINPEKLVVKEVREYLKEHNLLNSQRSLGNREFFVTDLNDRFVTVAEMFLGQKIKPDLKKIRL